MFSWLKLPSYLTYESWTMRKVHNQYFSGPLVFILHHMTYDYLQLTSNNAKDESELKFLHDDNSIIFAGLPSSTKTDYSSAFICTENATHGCTLLRQKPRSIPLLFELYICFIYLKLWCLWTLVFWTELQSMTWKLINLGQDHKPLPTASIFLPIRKSFLTSNVLGTNFVKSKITCPFPENQTVFQEYLFIYNFGELSAAQDLCWILSNHINLGL